MPADFVCPTCGGDVYEDDCYDYDVGTDTVTLYKTGTCDHCGNHYQWKEEFVYEGVRDVERIHEEDDEPDVDECGFDPYMGCYTDDC
jgi:hypothetical protein